MEKRARGSEASKMERDGQMRKERLMEESRKGCTAENELMPCQRVNGVSEG